MTGVTGQTRLAAVDASGLMDVSDVERHPFARIAWLAANAVGAPAAAVSVVDAEQRAVLAAHGPAASGTGWHELDRRVVEAGTPVVVQDTRVEGAHPRSSPAGIVAYAGVPLRDGAGEVLGALCAVQDRPRAWSAAEIELLEEISRFGTAEVTLRATAEAAERARHDDRSGQREAQRALVDAEARLALTVESAPIALFALDVDGRVTVSEGSALRAFGLESGQLVGESAFDLYAKRADVLADLRRALAGETLGVTHRWGDRVFEMRARPVWRDGKVTGIAGVSIDISDHLRDEARILELAYVDR